MNNSHHHSYPISGMSEQDAAKMLGSAPRVETIGDKVVSVIEGNSKEITVFCERGKVYSVRIQSPFHGKIRGIQIGDDKSRVIDILGDPHRKWPIHDGTDRWFYDMESFMRIDFAEDSGKVEFIYV